MWFLRAGIAGLVVLTAVTVTQAQSRIDRSFSTTSNDCSAVQWSQEALATYPKIADACQAVEERNGKKYVKFNGTVERNVDRGKQLEVKFKDGATIKLTPPENLALYVNDRKTSVRDLRRGDALTFYVPEGQFTPHFAQEQTASAQLVAAPVTQQASIGESEPERAASLPATASNQPWLLLAGLAALAAALMLTIRRVRRQDR